MSDWTDGLEVQGPGDTPAGPKRVVRRAAVASALIAGLGAAGYGVASAVSAGSSSAAASAPATTVARSSPARLQLLLGKMGLRRGCATGSLGHRDLARLEHLHAEDDLGHEVTVDVSSTTTYRDRGVTSPSFANVSVNEHVTVFGTTSSGTVTATSVLIGGAGGHVGFGEGAPPAASGIVTSLGSNTFTLKTTSGTRVTVDVSSTTTYRDRGVTSPSFANVSVNEHVAVFGTTSSGTVRDVGPDRRAGRPFRLRRGCATGSLGHRDLARLEHLHAEDDLGHERDRRRLLDDDLPRPGRHLAVVRQRERE